LVENDFDIDIRRSDEKLSVIERENKRNSQWCTRETDNRCRN